MKRIILSCLFILIPFGTMSAQGQSLAAPDKLTVSTISPTRLDLAWRDTSTGETGFKIERSINGNNAYTHLTQAPAGAVGYSDTSLPSASGSTSLPNEIKHDVTTIDVVSTSGFAAAGYIQIDTEIIKYTGTTATSFTGCTRVNLVAVGHAQGAGVYGVHMVFYRVRATDGTNDSAYSREFRAPTLPAGRTLTTLKLYPGTERISKGKRRAVTLVAYDSAGKQVKSIFPTVTSSNPAVAEVLANHYDMGGEEIWTALEGRIQVVHAVGAGTATVTAALVGINSNALTLTVDDPAATPSASITGAQFTGGVANVKVGQPVEISLEGSIGVASTRIQWGDGDETTELLSSVHAYREPGSKTVTVTVTNSAGVSQQATVSVNVTGFTPTQVLTATSISDLITKYNAATGGEEIRLAPGVYNERLVLPPRTFSDFVTITTSGTLPGIERRIDPVANLAQLVVVRSNLANHPPIEIQPGVKKVRIRGFKAEMIGVQTYSLIRVGEPEETVITQQPQDIIFEHCAITNPDNLHYHKGFENNGHRVSLSSSAIQNVFHPGLETHAVYTSNGKGGHVYYNNLLESPGSSFFYGGGTTFIEGLVPTNIELRRSYLEKPTSWRGDGIHRPVKTLLEFKSARRVYIAGTLFEYSWMDGQGYAINLKSSNQTDDSAWVTTEDVVFENCTVRHMSAGLYVVWDGYYDTVSRPASNIIFKNVLWDDISNAKWNSYDGIYGQFTLFDQAQDLTLRHNTVLTPDNHAFHFSKYSTYGLYVHDSIIGLGGGGIRSSLYTQGKATLDAVTHEEWEFTKNVLIAYSPDLHPLSFYPGYDDGTNKYPTTVAAVGFTNYAGGVYSLAAGSPYKGIASGNTDPGVNWDVLQAAVARAADGNWGPTPAAPGNLTFTHTVADTLPNRGVLNWADNSTGETGFVVESAPASKPSAWKVVATPGANVTTLNVILNDHTYYRVKAYNAAGDSLYSNVVLAGVMLTSNGLPSPWQTQDVGPVGIEGGAGYADGTYKLDGSGSEVWGGEDSFRYVYQTLSGDGQIVARVTAVQNTSGSAGAGVMFRQTLDDDAANVTLNFSPVIGGILEGFSARPSAGANTAWLGGTATHPLPHWLKLVRSGNTFTGYTSADGVTWTLVGSTTVAMSGTVYVGLYVCAANNSTLNRSTFDNVAVSAPAGLPSPWLTQDVGPVGVTGSGSYSGGTFTVKGAGVEVWGGEDSFRYVYQTLSGDGQIVARVTAVQNTSGSAGAGVMFRQTLGDDAANVTLNFSPVIGGILEGLSARPSAGANTTWLGGTATHPLPHWLKLVRSGNTFTGYTSADGVTWTSVGSTTVTMSSSVYVGLYVCSANNSTLNTSTFDNVSKTP